MSHRASPPHFIIIGAMKCATSTLHDQLARQPGIFMSSPKEPCFFSDDEQWRKGIDWYSSLFSEAPPNALCGESSTHYTKLPTHSQTIARMRKHLGDHVKFIYIMRHPIDRLVSQYIHEWTQRLVSSPIDQAIDEFPPLIEYSRYSIQLEPYLETFGPERVLPVFFEHMTHEPQGDFERIGRFIGYEGDPRWDDSISEQNVSSDRMRRSAVRDAIINLPGLKQVRQKLVPKSVRNRIKDLWSMKQRPQLSDANIERLTAIFDEDLSTLGRWLNVDLRCGNFRQVALQTPPVWASKARATVA